ncbi:tetratricopeptide repeat protein [Heliobacterium undosum]|uniref:Tetratricopeptide repeat protein n=1 Tax=Heliomicrobium undosum TaxID=121734 RepID=A0A845L4C9_9FIRM|nr:tetratricopeptide repeat protein [Heliomicrobium undosum]MZP29694.1 tetratricopeptide repeat protein [Heliomicrobium undosum]
MIGNLFFTRTATAPPLRHLSTAWHRFVAVGVIAMLLTSGCSARPAATPTSADPTAGAATNSPAPASSGASAPATSLAPSATAASAPAETVSTASPVAASLAASPAGALPSGAPVSEENRKKAIELYDKGYYAFDVEHGPNRLKKAISLYDQALALDPNCYQAYTGKGIAVAFMGNLDEALRLLDRAIAIRPDYGFAYYNRGLALKYHGRFDDALLWFDRSLAYDRDNAWTYFGMAAIYDAKENTRACMDNLAKAIEIMPYCKVTAREKIEEDFSHVKALPEFKKLIAE